MGNDLPGGTTMQEDTVQVRPWSGRAAQDALRWTKARGRRENLPCIICGQPIDYDLPSTDDMGCSVQHIKSRFEHPELTWDRTNWAPGHLACNKKAGAHWQPDTPSRLVIILCGPPGAGKTTIAHAQHQLAIYDSDDPQWTSQAAFTQAMRDIAADSTARAVIIRAGANTSARIRARRTARATRTYMVAPTAIECHQRVTARGDAKSSHQAIDLWFQRYDDLDHVPPFPGWDAILDNTGDTIDLGIHHFG
jgi:hypothetical protein